MKFARFFLIAAVTLVAMTGCSLLDPSRNLVPVALMYDTVEAEDTKAAQNLNERSFASGENIMVRISNTGESAWTDYMFTTGDAGAMTAPDPGPYYPAGSQNIDIVAYYPATAGSSFSVASDQTADADYKASDLMFASKTNLAKTSEAVKLTFSHKMAKLCVNITPGAGVTSITSVSLLNVKRTVSFNQATGAVGTATSAGSILMSNNGAALIPAQTINGGLLSIVTDKGTATYSVNSKAFEAGRRYTLNITVNLHAVGTTTAITGWNSQGTVNVNPVRTEWLTIVAVDLGGPHGIKWANMNVGARTETDYGDHFSWGETKTKTDYYWSEYSLGSGDDHWTLKKYCTNDYYSYYGEHGSDGKTQLELSDDAAFVNWGGHWRMPTKAEWEWLMNYCSWKWTTKDGVSGYEVSKNSSSIFLPAAGYSYVYGGNNGFYWSSTLNTDYPIKAWALEIGSGRKRMTNEISRNEGFSIRPVYVP